MILENVTVEIDGKRYPVQDVKLDFDSYDSITFTVKGIIPQSIVYNHPQCKSTVCFDKYHNTDTSGGVIEAMKKLNKALKGEDMATLNEVPENLKKFLNKNFEAFLKLGWVDTELNLTDTGKRKLWNFLLEQNEDAFGKIAQEEVNKLTKEEKGTTK